LEIEESIKGNVDAIVGDVDRMKVEAATSATAVLEAEITGLRRQLADARKEALKEGADIGVNLFRKRLGTL
jgi:predicted phage tail protein